MKEEPLNSQQMKELFSYIKACGKKTLLEVVAYTEDECIEGAALAKYCGCDILMGTIYFDTINEFCKKNNIMHMSFIGSIKDRPSVLTGSIQDMIDETNQYFEKGVYGVDLLGYRYTGNAFDLNKQVVRNT